VLVELSVMEQRYQGVLAVVQDGGKVSEVADRLGVPVRLVTDEDVAKMLAGRRRKQQQERPKILDRRSRIARSAGTGAAS
jgi:hypothetical protein